jgi:hypothetical protein
LLRNANLSGTALKISPSSSCPDFCFKTLTGDVPFQAVPEDVLFVLVGQQHQRLDRPTFEEVADCGLTDEMWELVWKCSDPNPSQRPAFSQITVATADLAKGWQPLQRAVGSSDTFSEHLCQKVSGSL